MQVASEMAIPLLDLLVGGTFLEMQHFVGVL